MDEVWQAIFKKYTILEHDFFTAPYVIEGKAIAEVTKDFKKPSQTELRLLCKHDTRESRPKVFRDNELFLLPTNNGDYTIVKGEGYIDLPIWHEVPIVGYKSKLSFVPETAKVGDSEMQHLDYAYAASVIRTFFDDESLVLTIRGRKHAKNILFYVGQHRIEVKKAQTEVDAGFEGIDRVVLIEAKNSKARNTIIRQLYFPYRQWKAETNKDVTVVFFERHFELGQNVFCIAEYGFREEFDYNSIYLRRAERFRFYE